MTLRQDLRTLDRRAVTGLLTAVIVLLLVQFRGKASWWREQPFLRERFPAPLDLDLAAQAAWATVTIIGFGLAPFLVATIGLRMHPRDLGFRAGGFLRHLGVYLALFLAMTPLLWWASSRPDFLETYPFPRLARTDERAFWIWQAFYLAQFVALEMFFRGFLLFTLERRFGLHAVLVMTIPYAMIHASKPMPEAFGAVVAGLLLGYLALRTRSFYGGVLLHYGVALSMDLLAREAATRTG